jgi:pyruvate dehydrogenase E2 component (dihydrolipoamide acetyltransferase)
VDADTQGGGAAEARVGTETKIYLPDLGDFHDVAVIEVLVAPGDQVAVESSLITLESDKATMEIPSPQAGTVRQVLVKVGDKINQGHLIAILDTEPAAPAAAPQEEDRATPAPPPPAAEEIEQVQAPVPLPAPAAQAAEEPTQPARLAGEKEQRPRPVIARPTDAPARKAHASPAVRRFARELGVDLGAVKGSGPKGRVLKEDVQGFVKRALAEGGAAPAAAGPLQLPIAAEVDWTRFGEVAEQPLSRIRKLSGAHLHRCWLTVPHVTQFDEADVTELEAFRRGQKGEVEREGVRLTLVPFLMKAVVTALQAMPQFNSALSSDGERLITRHYFNIGVAVDTPNGLVVPVVREVDRKGVLALARELGEVSARARDGKLLPADLQGGCFSISSLGGIGGLQFTPIVNAPEVAILGVSRAATKPVWDGTAFQPRLMLPLALSYDHRVIDGADGVRFTTLLAGLLGDVRRLLL